MQWCWLFQRGPNKQRLDRLRVVRSGRLHALLLERSSLLNQSIDRFDRLINSIDLTATRQKSSLGGESFPGEPRGPVDGAKRQEAFFVFDPFYDNIDHAGMKQQPAHT